VLGEGRFGDIIKDIFHEFNKGYKHEGGKNVEMDKPRPCSYNKKADYEDNGRFSFKETVTIGEPVPRQKSPNGSADITPMSVELRGITLVHQLRSIRANVKRRCVKEKWTDQEGNLPQPPRFFVIHFGGEPFFYTMDCIEQMFKDFKLNRNDDDDKKGGGMTEDMPIWICAFANNQYDLEDAITANPSESGFAKAMEVANYCTIYPG